MIIGLSGYAQAGKDTVGEHLVTKYGFHRIGLADVMKECLYKLNPLVALTPNEDDLHPHLILTKVKRLKDLVDLQGWDEVKKLPDVRRLLQRFGTEVGRETLDPDLWVRYAVEQMLVGEDYVITDVRFQNEANAVHNQKGEVWRIVRPGVGPANEHQSENEQVGCDVIIANVGTIEDLHIAVDNRMGSS